MPFFVYSKTKLQLHSLCRPWVTADALLSHISLSKSYSISSIKKHRTYFPLHYSEIFKFVESCLTAVNSFLELAPIVSSREQHFYGNCLITFQKNRPTRSIHHLLHFLFSQ